MVSPPPDTVAVFVTVAGALEATFTVKVIGGYEVPEVRTSDRKHVGFPPALHDHPLPLIVFTVRPAGRVSATVTVPDVDEAPTFWTVIVYGKPA